MSQILRDTYTLPIPRSLPEPQQPDRLEQLVLQLHRTGQPQVVNDQYNRTLAVIVTPDQLAASHIAKQPPTARRRKTRGERKEAQRRRAEAARLDARHGRYARR